MRLPDDAILVLVSDLPAAMIYVRVFGERVGCEKKCSRISGREKR